MYATLLADARFHDLLLAIDRDLADAARAEGCACGGRRHMARYRRKPRGRPCRLGSEHDQRFSFCCAVDGCRSRATPPSLRFLGRKVYVAAIVVLIAILQHGVSDGRLKRLAQVVSVDRRTITRWRGWWRKVFTATRFWAAARAGFMPPIDEAQQEALPFADLRAKCRVRAATLHERIGLLATAGRIVKTADGYQLTER